MMAIALTEGQAKLCPIDHQTTLQPMEQIATLHIEKLPEGVYLATSDDVPGLVAQGRTVAETIEIARDVAKKLMEAQAERHSSIKLADVKETFDYPLVIGM